MKGYLFIKDVSEVNSNENVREIIDTVKETKHSYTYDRENNISSYFYNNEGLNYDFLGGDYSVAYSGLLTSSYSELSQEISNKSVEENIRYISDLSGISSISFLHKPSSSVYAFNGFSGVTPVFYCETDSRIVIGTDPLVVNCIAYMSDKPQFDLSNIASFLMMGFFFSHDTLFKNVKSIPFNHFIKLDHEGIKIEPIDDSLNTVFTKIPNEENYEELANSFIEAFDVVPKEKPPILGLTGGKDSRLLVLGMQKNNINFNAVTRGHEDHPDVIIAKQLANKLNIPHSVKSNVPGGKDKLSVDLVNKILKTMKGTSGQLYGYENIGYQTNFKGNLGINGVGAESIRGGFAFTRSLDENADKHKALTKTYFPLKYLIKDEYTEKYDQELLNISESDRSIREIGNLLFLEFYNGNRTASARQALMYYSIPVSPFFDNKFLKLALQFDMEEISTEKLQFNLMKSLNSKAVEVPLANSRWLFEKDGPLSANSFRNWFDTEPVTPASQRGGYNWRLFKNKDKTFVDAFKDLLLDNPHSKVYEIVDFDQVKKAFETSNFQNLTRFLWALLSIKLYTEYYGQEHIESKKIELKLPSSKEIVKFKPEIFDLSQNVYPLNKKIIINTTELLISIDQTSDLNGYLVLGDNNLSTPVSDKYMKKFKVRELSKTMTFQMCVDNLTTDYSISMFIIQFDENKNRVKSQRIELEKLKLGENVFGQKFTPEKQSDNIKIAFVIKSKSSAPLFKLKYAFIRHN